MNDNEFNNNVDNTNVTPVTPINDTPDTPVVPVETPVLNLDSVVSKPAEEPVVVPEPAITPTDNVVSESLNTNVEFSAMNSVATDTLTGNAVESPIQEPTIVDTPIMATPTVENVTPVTPVAPVTETTPVMPNVMGTAPVDNRKPIFQNKPIIYTLSFVALGVVVLLIALFSGGNKLTCTMNDDETKMKTTYYFDSSDNFKSAEVEVEIDMSSLKAFYKSEDALLSLLETEFDSEYGKGNYKISVKDYIVKVSTKIKDEDDKYKGATKDAILKQAKQENITCK